VKNLRWVLALYLGVLAIAVSYPMGPARPPWKLHYLNDVKPSHVEVDALVQDIAQDIVLFLPAGYLGILTVGRTGAGATTLVVLACALLSFGIETVQHFFLPWRYSTWIDIMSNTLGGLAGTGVARLMTVPKPAEARRDAVADVRFVRAEDPPRTA
jgi:VanZ family protein